MENFIDSKFPHDKSSLCTGFKIDETKVKKWENLVWLRPHEFLNENKISIFGDGPKVDDIIQSKLRDCFMLACLSSLALYPERINKLIRIGEQEGKYIISFFINGKFRDIEIDDYIPCKNDFYRPKFAKPSRNKLWVLFLEKAYAKINRHYENLIFGRYSECGMLFTGAPTYNYYHKNLTLENLSDKLATFLNSKFVCGSLTPVILKGGNIGENGLVEGHFYSVFGLVKLSNGETYVNLRDPKGKFNWKYDLELSPDPEQARKMRDELYCQKKSEDSFFMKISDFKKSFTETVATHVRDNFCHSYLKIQMEESNFKFIQFSLHKPTNGYISVCQPNKRKYKGKDSKYIGAFLGLQIYKNDNGNLTFICGYKECLDMITYAFPNSMMPGDYILIAHVNWETIRKQKLYISCYAEYLTELRESSLGLKDMEKFLLVSAVSNGKIFELDSIGEFGIKIYNDTNSNNSNFGSVTIVNNSKYTVVDFEVYFLKNPFGIRFLPPYEGNNAKLVSYPNTYNVVPVELFSFNFKFKVRFNYKISHQEIPSLVINDQIAMHELLEIIKNFGSIKEAKSKLNDAIVLKMYVLIYKEYIYFLFTNEAFTKYKADINFILEGLELIDPKEKTHYTWLIELGVPNFTIKKMKITSELFNFQYDIYEII